MTRRNEVRPDFLTSHTIFDQRTLNRFSNIISRRFFFEKFPYGSQTLTALLHFLSLLGYTWGRVFNMEIHLKYLKENQRVKSKTGKK